METIRVKPTGTPNADGSGKVVIGVPDEHQPSGSLFIAIGHNKKGEQVEYNVTKTPLVDQLILDKKVIEVPMPPKKGRPPKQLAEGENS